MEIVLAHKIKLKRASWLCSQGALLKNILQTTDQKLVETPIMNGYV